MAWYFLIFLFCFVLFLAGKNYKDNSNSIVFCQPHVAIYAAPTHSNSHLHQKKLIQLIQASDFRGGGSNWYRSWRNNRTAAPWLNPVTGIFFPFIEAQMVSKFHQALMKLSHKPAWQVYQSPSIWNFARYFCNIKLLGILHNKKNIY